MRVAVISFFVLCFYFGSNATQNTGDSSKEKTTQKVKGDFPAGGNHQRNGESTSCRQTGNSSQYTKNTMPTMQELLYPVNLIRFDFFAANCPEDMRIFVYAIKDLHVKSKKPFSDEELSFGDFGKKQEAYRSLLKQELIQKLEPEEEIEYFFTKDELLKLLQERGLSKQGRKHVLAERLAANGFKIDRRKYRKHLFWLTEKGKMAIQTYYSDRREAINDAIIALKDLNYRAAIAAYRRFDDKWGFIHTSGKSHTIFAHYDISADYFLFFECYAMSELNNTPHFRSLLRACLLAGLMRGTLDEYELVGDFANVCDEKLSCPGLLTMFDYPWEILDVMRKQMENDPDRGLGYYINHLQYLSRKNRL